MRKLMTDKRTKIIQAEIGSDPAYGSVTAPYHADLLTLQKYDRY